METPEEVAQRVMSADEPHDYIALRENIAAAIRAAILKEREECAEIADADAEPCCRPTDPQCFGCATQAERQSIAAAIRSRAS